MAFSILIVDDEREMCTSLAELFTTRGFEASATTDAREALLIAERTSVDLVVMDVKMPRVSGLDLLRQFKDRLPAVPVIMITGYPSVENAVTAMRFGALNFYVKPLRVRELLDEVARIAAVGGTRVRQHGEHRAAEPIVWRSARMREVLAEVERVAPTDASVLVTGESGTGKELVAESIHRLSPRAARPFVKLNCASIPDTLLESELFGHERGAFTDAIRRHVGKLECAEGGTLFLDEIADMSIHTQPKLLRVLQDGEYQRLGGTETLTSTARIIAATNRDVEQLLSERILRDDLFYRIAVVSIHLPPLRERGEDIEPLVAHFLARFIEKYGKRTLGMAPGVSELLLRHHWPGNVRELRNCIERAVIFCDGDTIEETHLPAQYRSPPMRPVTPEEVYAHLSRERILDALTRCEGVREHAAKLLKISRKTLYNRMRRLGIE